MEILMELFITAFVAFFFSFLLAKLLSVDTVFVTDSILNCRKIGEEEAVVEKVRFDGGRFEFQGTESETRLQFVVVGDHVVNQLEGEELFQKSQISNCCEEFGQIFCQENKRDDDDEYVGEVEEQVMNLDMKEVTDDDEMIKNEQSEEMVVREYQSVEAGDDPPLSEVGNENNQKVKEKDELVSENKEDYDDDDWEGIEKSELETIFAKAANYVAGGGLPNMDSDVQMQLNCLQKIALCQEPQPVPFKISVCAKWNAWRKMGTITPETAMEQYIALLSTKYPSWREEGT